MSQGPSFEVNSRYEMSVLCHSWYGLPLCVKKKLRFVWLKKGSLNVTLETSSVRTFPGKGNLQQMFLPLAPIERLLVCASPWQFTLFFPCMTSKICFNFWSVWYNPCVSFCWAASPYSCQLSAFFLFFSVACSPAFSHFPCILLACLYCLGWGGALRVRMAFFM